MVLLHPTSDDHLIQQAESFDVCLNEAVLNLPLSDPGAALQLGHLGHATQYPPAEDAAATPPSYQLLRFGGGPGPAGEKRVRQRRRAHTSYHYS